MNKDDEGLPPPPMVPYTSDDESESSQKIAADAFQRKERPTNSGAEQSTSKPDVNRVPWRKYQNDRPTSTPNGNHQSRKAWPEESSSSNVVQESTPQKALRKRSASKRKERKKIDRSLSSTRSMSELIPHRAAPKLLIRIKAGCECCGCCRSSSLPPPAASPPSKSPLFQDRVSTPSTMSGLPEFNKRFFKNDAVKLRDRSGTDTDDWYEGTMMQVRDWDDTWTDDDRAPRGIYGSVIRKATEYIAVAGVTGLIIFASRPFLRIPGSDAPTTFQIVHIW